ncbi:acyltransferase family protein [Massilia yuzhufengensis]|uniref:Peptidoglycan/LPS O-acetylase OafA/YrhL, contains acyltransferase and SGNH-hydrolase domains n=1 Tax=Massilia yuzhufengensis TaxID=1164594 RepID=A0A1I1Q3N9_9BURK|nr:acyltransferase family protein [Massilia yuzhufengensis]SFD16607.1 Peptidoglycan/LPS O-acetylase OafA/YrhL, contains acyltransferase and SGNH-hydrolase domains [Massilia yuzhufengensis]
MKLEQQIQFGEPSEPPIAPATHLAYRRDIDGLRAVAVLAVVIFHAFPAVLRGGFIGVDIFFVISGFLISSILLRELQQGVFSFAGFYARRVKRIFPALILVIAACLAFGWLALFPDEYEQLGKHVVGGAGFAANFFYWAQVGYFDTASDTKPLLHLWSLGIEEQFYILWPVVLLAAWRLRLNLLMVAAVLAMVSFAVNVGFIAQHPTATFYSPASRAWELLLGAGLACLHARPAGSGLGKWSPNLVAWTGVALLAAGLALITRERHFPGWFALLPALGALLLIGAGPQAWFNRVVLSNRLMVWVGLISYPLYLWHWPLLSFAQIIESREPSPAIRAGAVLLAILLAWLTYRVMERPLRAGAARGKVAALCALMLAIAATGAYIYLNGGLPGRKPVQDNLANHKALLIVEDKANAAACKKRYGFDSDYEYCLLADVAKDPTVVLLGDSHAYHVVAGLTRYYSSIGDNLLMLGTRHPYWGLDPHADPYQQATQQMVELAIDTPSVKTVVFSTHLRFYTVPEQKLYVDAARETFRRLLAAGKHVIFMHDVPLIGFDPRSCIKRAGVASSATRVPCAIPRGEWDQQIAQHMEVVKGFATEFPQIEWFDASAVLCDDRQCDAMIDGRLMYRDNNHLSYEGDLMVGSRFGAWRQERTRE